MANETKVSVLMPKKMKKDKNITPMAKIIYMEICGLSVKYGYCYATNTYLAEAYGKRVTEISRYLRELSDAGYIRIDAQVQSEGKNRRIYVLPQSDEDDEEPKKEPEGPITKNGNGYSQNREWLLPKTAMAITKNGNGYYQNRQPEDVSGYVTEEKKERTATQLQRKTACGSVPSSSSDGYGTDPDKVGWDRYHTDKVYNAFPKAKRTMTIKEFRSIWPQYREDYPKIMSVLDDFSKKNICYLPNIRRFFQERIYDKREVFVNSDYLPEKEKEDWRWNHMTDDERNAELDSVIQDLEL